MSLEAFGAGKRHRGRAERTECPSVELQHRRALHEIEDAEA
jgi:hypothetical protein